MLQPILGFLFPPTKEQEGAVFLWALTWPQTTEAVNPTRRAVPMGPSSHSRPNKSGHAGVRAARQPLQGFLDQESLLCVPITRPTKFPLCSPKPGAVTYMGCRTQAALGPFQGKEMAARRLPTTNSHSFPVKPAQGRNPLWASLSRFGIRFENSKTWIGERWREGTP